MFEQPDDNNCSVLKVLEILNKFLQFNVINPQMIIEFQIQRLTGCKFLKFFLFFLPISCRPIKSLQLPLKAKINKMKKQQQQQCITYGNYIFSIIAVGIVVVIIVIIIIFYIAINLLLLLYYCIIYRVCGVSSLIMLITTTTKYLKHKKNAREIEKKNSKTNKKILQLKFNAFLIELSTEKRSQMFKFIQFRRHYFK